jgi:prepilin-type N-terminal cleavage/methylation domain-containing protein
MRNSGFTLLEVLLSIATMAIIVGISLPIAQSFQVRNDLHIAVNTFVQTLRRAQILAQAVDGDMSWGVKVQSASVTLFKGVSYAARDTSVDEIFDVPTSIVPSGLTEIVFTKWSGLPEASGTATFTTTINETRNVTINQKGILTY